MFSFFSWKKPYMSTNLTNVGVTVGVEGHLSVRFSRGCIAS